MLHTAISLAPGGRSEAIRTLARHSGALGIRSDLCCLDHQGAESESIASTFDRHLVLGRRKLFDWSAIRRLAHYCDERGIQLIHTHTADGQATAALLRLIRPRLKAIMTFHRSLGIDSSNARHRVRNALATTRCEAIVVGSRERREHFLRENYVPVRKVVRIPFGIDVDRFRPDASARTAVRRELGIDETTVVFGAAGHFGDEKGVDVVLRAFEAFSSRLPASARALLVVVGKGDDERSRTIHELAARLPAGRVFLAGYRRDIERWFNAMDVFVHAPRLEAFGLAVAEAMATGLPVVATSVGGVTDIVRSGVTGVLVPSEDIAELARAMQSVWHDRELRHRLAAAGEALARAEYSADLYARRYLNLYEDILAGRPPQGVDDVSPIPAGNALESSAESLRETFEFSGSPCQSK